MENTDRELLELAAKVSGIPTPNWIGTEHEWLGREGVIFNDEYDCNQIWNPLTDDGDAFRLAHKLNIAVTQYPIYTSPKHSVIAKVPSLDVPRAEALELHGEDKLQATRRAIVRCAAEIGRMMKE